MMVYIFDAAKRVRKILSPGSITELVHDEGAYSLSAAISMDAAVKNGEHIGFKCVDGHFRIFTVTQSENFDDAATAYITARDAIVMELMETIVEDLQQLDVQLLPAIEGLLAAAQTQSAWTVTGAQPERVEKSRAYYTDLWTMLETFRTLYEWQIIPYYTFSGGQISGRVIELKEDKAEFRGRILRSKKDASNVYDIKTNPPITRLYVLGKATGTEDEPKNESIREVVWSVSAGDPVDKPKGQPWIEDPQAVAEYGVHTAVVQINDAQDDKDLIAKGWKHLQTVKKPTSTVTATIQDLEQVPGYENQVIRLGDLVPIRLVNATMEEARVVGIKRDYLHHWLTKLTIGDKEATIQTQVSTLMTNATHTFERLEIFKNRFHEDEALIQLNAEMIQANAHVIELNAEQIRANAELINLKAGKEEVTELGTIITGAMIELDGLKGLIDLKASKAELTETQNRLSQAEVRIDGAETAIDLKAERTTVDALGTRISAAEIEIDGANSRVDILAEEIRLAGYVTADELETETLKVVDGATLASLKTGAFNCSGIATISTLYVGTGAVIPSLVVGGEYLSASTLSMGSVVNSTVFGPSDINLSHSHAVTVDGGTVTLGEVSSSGGSFNIADTKFYKDGVAAAKEKGARLVNVSNMFGSEGVITAQLSNGKEGTLQLSQGTASGKEIPILGRGNTVMTVNASGIYDAGYTAGEDSVTLSSSGWSNNVNTITASNGKTMKVTRYYRTANTVSSGDTVFVSYNGAMVNATYRSGGSTLTYISSVVVE